MKTSNKFSFRKTTSAMIAIGLIAVLMTTGTFAWQAIRNALNEASNAPAESELHDDYDPETGEKNIYVENTGKTDIFVRLRLDEFLTLTAHDTSAFPGFTSDPNASNYRDFWTTHSPENGDYTICDETSKNEGDHYHAISDSKGFEWTFAQEGSQKYYMHAKDMPTDYIFPGYVQDTTVYPNAAYAVGAPEIGQTLPSYILTMDAYKNLADSDSYTGWVYDQDGWVYWSKPLPKGTATGVLLESVNFESMKNEEYYYAINAVMECVDKSDLHAIWLSGGGSSPLSDDAKSIFNNYKNSVNKAKLQDAINDAETLDMTDVDAELLDTFNDAVNNGKTVMDNAGATQNEVNDAESAIRDAIKAIEDSKNPPADGKLELKDGITEITTVDNSTTGALVARVTSDDGVRITYFAQYNGSDAYGKIPLYSIFDNTTDDIQVTIKSAVIKSGSSFNGQSADYTGDIIAKDGLLLIRVLPKWQQMWDVYSETGNLDDYALDIVVTFTQKGQTSDEFTIHAGYIPSLVD